MKRASKTKLSATASKKTRGNRDIVLSAVQENALLLEHATNELKKDRDIVLAAVQQNGISMRLDISEEFKGNKEVILAAVKQYERALNFASEDLRNNKDIVLAAVRKHGKSLHFASKELLDDKLFLIKCYRLNKSTITYNYFIREFDKLENVIFNNKFIEKNVDILDLVENKEQLCEYLLKNKKYRTIYDNEDISNNIRDKYKIVILSLDDIKPITDDNTVVVTEKKTEEEIKKEYENRYIGFQVIFIL